MNGRCAAAIDPATKVLLSFSVADRGSMVLDRIMVTSGWYAPDSVYVDNMAMRSREATYIRIDRRHEVPA